MLRDTVALACALFCIAGSLNVRESLESIRLRGRLPERVPEVNGTGSGSALDHINRSISERNLVENNAVNRSISERNLVENNADSNFYCGCNSTSCSSDAAKVSHDLENDLVLIFGCSLDINAIEYFCKTVGSPVQNFATRNPFAYLAHCNVGKFTLAYIFHPGASPPPYFSEYAGTATTMDVVRNSVHDVMMQFGREPSAIIVDSSLWDVSNWWQKNGRPAEPYAVPAAEIQQWCARDVPDLLRGIQATYPRSGVAFRTPPTVFPDNGYGQQPKNIDAMVSCIEGHKDPLNKIYGHYGYIDYHSFVDQVLEHAQGSAMKVYYKDSLHPGASLSLMYMNRVLNWARGLHR